jgi:hypothetical protein
MADKFGGKISKAEFEAYINRFQKRNPDSTKSVVFDRSTFERILANPDVVSVSVFLAEDPSGKTTVVVGGRDKDNNVLDVTLENRGGPCPPYC